MRIISAIISLINYIISLFTKPEPSPVPPNPGPEPEPQPNPDPRPIPPPNPDGVTVLDYDKELLEEHNKLRNSPLVINPKLVAAATNHAVWMAKNNRMSHTANGGMTNRVVETGYKYSGIAENIAAGQSTVKSVMSAWRNSGGHYRNITGNYKEVGFGVASKNGKISWCVVFGNPR